MEITDINFNEATLVDVRTEAEYAMDHLDRAINIPLAEIIYQIDELERMKKPIILYCHSGVRSGEAVEILKLQGIDGVYNGGAIDNLKKILS